MSIFLILLLFGVLLFIVFLAHWPIAALYLKQRNYPEKPELRASRWLSLKLSTAFLSVFILSELWWSDLNRIVANYLGLLTISFFTAIVGLFLIRVLPSWSYLGQTIRTQKGGAFLAIFVLLVCLFASYNYHKEIAVEEYQINSSKVSRTYRFVQLSDIQYGTTTLSEMNKILEKAYSLEPEFIVFTGDLIDFDNYAEEDFALLAKSPVPIYFERGNHEFYHHPERLMHYLGRVGPIQVLANAKTHHEELEIVGLDFTRRKHNVAKQMETLSPSNERFSILLYHEPREVEVASKAGFDLLLYGHTHGGQMWPYTWIVDWIYPFGDGAYWLGDTFAYTSDGASLWGPRMRLGSQNEMTLFTINPSR